MLGYHITHARNLESILSHGLITDAPQDNFNTFSAVAKLYGDTKPVYCAIDKPWVDLENLREDRGVPSHTYGMGIRNISEILVFEVDLTGLKLDVDLPSLVDKYCRFTERGMYFDSSRFTDEELAALDFEYATGNFEFSAYPENKVDHSIRQDPRVLSFFTKITSTVAVMETITPDRLTISPLSRVQSLATA